MSVILLGSKLIYTPPEQSAFCSVRLFAFDVKEIRRLLPLYITHPISSSLDGPYHIQPLDPMIPENTRNGERLAFLLPTFSTEAANLFWKTSEAEELLEITNAGISTSLVWQCRAIHILCSLCRRGILDGTR